MCVITIAFPLQQWLHERASMFRYTYNYSLILNYMYLFTAFIKVPVITEGHVKRKGLAFLQKIYYYNLKIKFYTDMFHGIILTKPVIKLWSETVFDISYFLSLTSRFSFPRISLLLCQSCVIFVSTYSSKQMFLLGKRHKKFEILRL